MRTRIYVVVHGTERGRHVGVRAVRVLVRVELRRVAKMQSPRKPK